MSVLFTPFSNRLQSEKEWLEWLNKRRKGDKVCIQEFIEQGVRNNSVFSQVECWSLRKATITAVFKRDGDLYHTAKGDIDTSYFVNGLRVGSGDQPIKDVFYTRLVPTDGITHKEKDCYVDCHFPIYEPNWKYRYVTKISNNGLIHNRVSSELRNDQTCCYYYLTVRDGYLFILFTELDNIDELLSRLKDVQFLYSERLTGFPTEG